VPGGSPGIAHHMPKNSILHFVLENEKDVTGKILVAVRKTKKKMPGSSD
jgi:hypothetical protein